MGTRECRPDFPTRRNKNTSSLTATAAPAADLPLHVRPGVRGGVSGLLVDRGQPQRQPPQLGARDVTLRFRRWSRLPPGPGLPPHGGGAEAVPRGREAAGRGAERVVVPHRRRAVVAEGPGLRAYIQSDGAVYRTYVTTARGLETGDGLLRPLRPYADGPQRARRVGLVAAPPRRVRRTPLWGRPPEERGPSGPAAPPVVHRRAGCGGARLHSTRTGAARAVRSARPPTGRAPT
jgi:hypothetical protein